MAPKRRKASPAQRRLTSAIRAIHFAPGNTIPFSVVQELQRRLIREALRMTDGNVLAASRVLKVKRDLVRYKILTLHMERYARHNTR